MKLSWWGTVLDNPRRVRGLLCPERWNEWLPGLASLEPTPAAPGERQVRVDFDGWRPVHVLLRVEASAHRLEVEALEGDFLSLVGGVRLQVEPDRVRLHWQLQGFPRQTIPGPVARELEAELLPSWHRALVQRLQSDGLPPADEE